VPVPVPKFWVEVCPQTFIPPPEDINTNNIIGNIRRRRVFDFIWFIFYKINLEISLRKLLKHFAKFGIIALDL
jgi:hypothetical protein